MSLARAEQVTMKFGDVLAVDSVDLQVDEGEVVGLLGANGAGKTTLIRMLLGLLRASEGAVRLFGSAPSRQTRSGIGYVPQGLGLYEDLTAGENLEFAASVFGAMRDPGVELRAVLQVLVRDLPQGLRRRLSFAQALGHNPRLLVLDEPTSGVDPLARARLWETIRDTAESGAGVLVTTHHMEEADECDRLVVMSRGKVVASGTIEEIIDGAKTVMVSSENWDAAFDALDQPGVPMALVGRSLRLPEADPAGVARTLQDAGVDADVRLVEATFEEVFASLVMRGSSS